MVPSTELANAVVNGLVTGSIVALGAIGLSLVYNIAEVPNFSHGEFLMLGAYVALFVNQPDTVPVFEALADARTLGTAGYVVLFALTVVPVLSAVSLLGGTAALKGSWWPGDPNPAVALGAHALAAATLGAVVVVGFPSIWAGLLLSGAILAAVAPLLEKGIFRKFRAKEASLATMLIVTLGLSFVLRFGTQAVYGGDVRTYEVPSVGNVFGYEVGLSAAKFFDFYATSGGVTLDVIDTAPTPPESMFAATYSWVAVAAVLAVTLGAAYAGYRWRRGGDEFGASRTVGPKLAASALGLAGFVASLFLLAGPGSVPESAAYSTRVRLSVMRASVLFIAVGMMGSLHFLLQETKLGTAMRASSDNIDLAKITGINTDRVMMATWIIAGAFAAVAGVMLGVLFSQLTVNMGFFLLLPMFAGVILGGLQSVYGAILGSYVVGLSMDVGIYAIPGVGSVYRIPIAFVILFVVLLVKPEGITGGS
ncbi:branched-chain amino acid ABC transporter permease [Halorussus salilacus]|uniref:branched-chain amino acid ABC transporter permease n=1 Tax=Halorussus salilacus TaxID=2953750 RepID=UPI00209FDF05|nr:branched-chain amino acid ABC transporter permease [Halorussus salilacus]USZ68147.1 branched-chain amino acid ABC transporter permease [Halorussus salilacus]